MRPPWPGLSVGIPAMPNRHDVNDDAAVVNPIGHPELTSTSAVQS